MFKRIDFQRENYPYFFYQLVPIRYAVETVCIQLDRGFNYILQKIYEKHNDIARAKQEITVSIIQQNQMLQNVPVNFALMTSPGSAGITAVTKLRVSATQTGEAPYLDPAIPDYYRPGFPATEKKQPKTLNYPFIFHGNIYLEITGQSVVSNTNMLLNSPSFVELFLTGRYYPEKALRGMA